MTDDSFAGFTWQDEWLLGYAPMDQVHEAFVEVVARMLEAPEAQMAGLLDEFETHAREHFDAEDPPTARRRKPGGREAPGARVAGLVSRPCAPPRFCIGALDVPAEAGRQAGRPAPSPRLDELRTIEPS
jgi:hypothetical protein